MGWSSGTFTLTTTGLPYVTGTTISSTVANNLNTELQTGINQALNKDGSNTPTANLNLGGFRLTNIGGATVSTDAIRASQVQANSLNTVTSVSGVTTITGSLGITFSSYTEGMTVRLNPVGTNTGQPSLNLGGIGAVPIYWNLVTATSSFFRAGNPIDLVYISTSSLTGFHVIGMSGFLPASIFTAKGDLLVGTASNAPIPLSVGTDDQILVATATASRGMAWKNLDSFAATQAIMEAATSTANYVPPLRQHFHPSAVKCWGYVTFSGGASPTLASNYGIGSITDTATGRTTITFATAFSTTNYASWATVESSSGNGRAVQIETGKTAAAMVVNTFNLSSTNLDLDFSCGAAGDQ